MKSLRLTILFAMLVAMGLVFTPSAWGLSCFHGITLLKNASSPVVVGNPYYAAYFIANADSNGNTEHVTSLTDTVHASGGDVTSANLLDTLTWTFTGGGSSIGPSHMSLPPGATAESAPYSHYTTVTNDFFLANHKLPDQVTILWHNVCNNDANSGCNNCDSTEGQIAQTTGQATVTAPLPCVSVTKKADCDVARVGKLITYTIKVENCGPNPLTKDSITDTLLGSLGGCNTLAVDANCTITTTRTIQSGDANPLVNTVQVNYHDQFNQSDDANASASVDIIDPNFTVTKTCTSKPIPGGGPATFNVAIHNTGDVDVNCTTNEAAQSDTSEPFIVAVGATKNITISIPTDGTVDVNNTITVTGNVTMKLDCPITDIVRTSNLVTCFPFPTIDVNKVADCDVAMVGKLITYTITIKNTGGDTLTLVSVIDTLLGDITSTAQSHGCTTLAGGAQCSFTVTRTIQQSDPATLDNMVTVVYVDNEQQQATDNATASVAVISPDFTVTKTCTSEPIPAGGPATFNVVIHNIGDVDLSFTTNEAAQSSLPEPFIVIAGATQNLTITIPTSGTSDVLNTIDVNGTVVDNSTKCPVPPIIHSAQAVCNAGGETRTWGFWAQHCNFTERVFNCCRKTINLGWITIEPNSTGLTKIYTIFRMHDDKKGCQAEGDLCKARIQASVQALAAILSSCLSNGASLPIDEDTIKDTLKKCDVNDIKDLGDFLAAHNESGDSNTPLFDCNKKGQGSASGGCAKTLGTACSILNSPCNKTCP